MRKKQEHRSKKQRLDEDVKLDFEERSQVEILIGKAIDNEEVLYRIAAHFVKKDPLVAAAPDLLAALELILEEIHPEGCPNPDCLVCQKNQEIQDRARAAIAKAKGEA